MERKSSTQWPSTFQDDPQTETRMDMHQTEAGLKLTSWSQQEKEAAFAPHASGVHGYTLLSRLYPTIPMTYFHMNNNNAVYSEGRAVWQDPSFLQEDAMSAHIHRSHPLRFTNKTANELF